MANPIHYPAAPSRAHMKAPPDWASLLNEVGINASDLYHQIVGAVTRGSGVTPLAWDDFDFRVKSGYNVTGRETALELMDQYMPPLDAIIWVNGQDRPTDLAIGHFEDGDEKELSAADIYSGFFAWYFSLYTQGRPVAQGNPNFLTDVLGLGKDWPDLIGNLSSADIERFPVEWVKNVNLGDLSVKSRNHLALGAAGHRYIACLKYIRSEDFTPNSAGGQQFILGIREWTKDRVWWDIHSITKSGNIITVTGSINKLIEDCLAKCVSADRLLVLVEAKILHHLPKEVPTHSNWVNFDTSLLPELREPIF